MAWWRKLRRNFDTAQLRDEIEGEIGFHREMREREYTAAGMNPAEAARAARQRFGPEQSVLEATRSMDILTWLESWLQDARHALRMLRRTPGFTAIVVLSLAIGIGANAAIFSLMDAVLLRALPVAHPEQIFLLSQHTPDDSTSLFSYPLFEAMRRQSAPAADLAAGTPTGRFYLPVAGSTPQRVTAQLVSGNYFQTLGVAPDLGRLLGESDNATAASQPVAVLGYGFWQKQFGGSKAALGQSLVLNGVACTIIGVAPPAFYGLHPNSSPDAWIPLSLQPRLHYNQNSMTGGLGNTAAPWTSLEGIMWLDVVARVPRPSDAAQLPAMLSPMLRDTWKRLGDTKTAWTVAAQPGAQGSDGLRRQYQQPLWALMGMVGLMLTIACANVATMLLARGVARQREIAIRLSIGISRARLVRQLVTEGVLLAAGAGALGLAIAYWGTGLLARMAYAGGTTPTVIAQASALDWRVFGFIALVSLLTGILVGLLPASQSGKFQLASALKSDRKGGTGSAPAGGLPLGRWLVVAQVALSLLLVAGAGLFSRSLGRLARLDPGFDRDHVLSFRIDPRAAGYTMARLPDLYRRLREQVEAVPGVRAVSFSTCELASSCTESTDVYFTARGNDGYASEASDISAEFLTTTGMRLVRGRGFNSSDLPNTPPVALVNQTFAAHYFPGLDPVGQRFGTNAAQSAEFAIVGVVADARLHDLTHPPVAMFFQPLEQDPDFLRGMEIRTAASDPAPLAGAIKRAIAVVDANFPAESAISVRERLDQTLNNERMIARLSAGFGILALGLACFGLYGVISYLVTRRSAEFGIRMALGAPREGVLWMVLRDALLLVAGGLAVGLPLTLLGARAVQSLLYGVPTADPLTLVGAFAAMLALPSLAALIPAWRATRIDPMSALRGD